MSHTPIPADRHAHKRALLGELRCLLPASSVLHAEEALKPCECDGLTAYRQVPLVAVLSDTVERMLPAVLNRMAASERIPTMNPRHPERIRT